MTNEVADRLDEACRPVTADEVDHLHEHGWVKLRGFVDPDVIAEVLALAREAMGVDADSNPLSPRMEKAIAAGTAGLSYFNAQPTGGVNHPVIGALIKAVGKSAQVLQNRTSPSGGPLGVRYYSDFFVPKLPSG